LLEVGDVTESAKNIDERTVEGFGDEWSAFDQTGLSEKELQRLFDGYFGIFPFDELRPGAEGFDLGCGSGRWAAKVVDRVGLLHCIDPSADALGVARKRLGDNPKARFHLASADSIPLPDGSQDFGYSLGVLHHVPDTRRALADCVHKLKPGAPFLVYLYYALDDRPRWFRLLWRASDVMRRRIARLPFRARKAVTNGIAALVYWPLARAAGLAKKMGADASAFPLSAYSYRSFYSMRTDALDRFGTALEHRFTRSEIEQMMAAAGLREIRFSETEPYWVACGIKS
jgi:ubiquinone/menaquinone biosynthesis C-methylase UbiE